MGLREEFAKLDIEGLKALWVEAGAVESEAPTGDEAAAFLYASSAMERNAEAYPVIIELGRFIAQQLHILGYPEEMSHGAIFGTDSVAFILRIYDEQQQLEASFEAEPE